ncbi:MAG TPA: GH92 family glycosyl hydrolase, partial [Bacteroidales bacterium]|nr:GH92 family glycosyl hydrolase [Bacteroidales bacterium]
MRKYLLLVFCAFAVAACSNKTKVEEMDYTRYVDPFIGTGYHGHVFLGANVPFGAVQVGPQNYVKGWDWCSGYHYSDSIVTGFSQMHLSGTGIGDLGDVLITPFTGQVKTFPGNEKEPLSGYASLYSHSDETAQAGYYSVKMKRYDILVELTASERVAMHKYTFPASDSAHIAINLVSGIGWDKPVNTFLKKVSDDTYVGYRFSTGWAVDQRMYFAIKLSKPVEKLELFEADKAVAADSAKGGAVVGVLSFATKKGDEVLLKVGVSPVSESNALKNIEAEIPGWDFKEVAQSAHDAWNKELGRIAVKGKNEDDLRTFYTAMYHAFTQPVLFNDHNGDYRGADKNVYTSAGFNNYSIFSLWDTYRAAHPFYTIAQPQRVSDMINTMLNIYKQQGKLPIWHLMGNETNCMVGYSAIPVIADAYFKGFKGFDPELAFEAMKASSTRDDFGMKLFKEKGYIPADKEIESVSKSMEYAISDWCIAQMAKSLGKTADYDVYSKRALAYAQYFDPKTQFIRAKLDNGKFREPFSPFQSIHGEGDYTEGNAWQYTWLVPQDVEGLIKLFGGDEPFIKKLDSLFVVKGDMGEKASSDISGLIGQYAHGNEPSHHITYLYAYAGQQWKTAEKNRYIQRNLYTDKTDGLCGNEDCGQMSSWYLMSSMGFYPANPASGAYVFGSPLFDEVTVNLPDQKQFTLKANNNSEKNIYIQSVKLNGNPYTKSYITYKDIMKGGTLEFEMGPEP